MKFAAFSLAHAPCEPTIFERSALLTSPIQDQKIVRARMYCINCDYMSLLPLHSQYVPWPLAGVSVIHSVILMFAVTLSL